MTHSFISVVYSTAILLKRRSAAFVLERCFHVHKFQKKSYLTWMSLLNGSVVSVAFYAYPLLQWWMYHPLFFKK